MLNIFQGDEPMLKKYFNNFLHYAVLVVLIITFIYGVLYLMYTVRSSKSIFIIAFIAVVYLSLFFYYNKYKVKINSKLASISILRLLIYIIITGFILRLMWIILVPTYPVSDFSLIYEVAGQASSGIFDSFKGTAYFARFSHNTVTILLLSVFYKFTDNPLFLIKLFNVICQTVGIYALYLASSELFGKNRALISASIIAFFPPFIMYSSQIMSENIAMPFYILSVYFFLKASKEVKSIYLVILSGVLLSTANMFRMVGIIFITAYVVYSLVYKGLKEGSKNSAIILAAYLIPLYLVSQSLILANITETHLWKPKESSFTSMLRGSNIQYRGRWNEEDASLPEKYKYDMEKVNDAAKEIVIERLTTTPLPKLLGHFVTKISTQWGMGDFGAPGWTISHSKDSIVSGALKYNYHELNFIIQLMFLTLLIRVFKALLKKDYINNEQINFLYILFGGFVLLYMISENQERYAFIVCWLFIIFGTRDKSSKQLI
jgi:hypothetical protein